MELVFERLQRRQPQEKTFPELRRILVAVPPSRRESAGGYGAISRAPLWSFGGQGRKPANVGIHTKTWKMKISQVCAPRREKRTCLPKLVRARCTGPGTLRALQQPPALGIVSWSRLSSTASTAPSFVIDLFGANTDLQQFFLNRGVQCAKLDLFFDDHTICSTRNQEILRIPVMLSPPYLRSQLLEIIDLCKARHDLGDCQL